jgi:hypothetical protein
MDKVQIIELGAGASILVAGSFLLYYIRKVKSKLRRFILRKEMR